MENSMVTSMFLSLLLMMFITSNLSYAGEEIAVQLPCSGKVGDCLWQDGQEMEMDSESNRRVLWAAAVPQKKYISYEALKGDVVPCDKPGVSYYDCHTIPRAAGSYNRGCQMITQCRGG